jgi:hypothetical protein
MGLFGKSGKFQGSRAEYISCRYYNTFSATSSAEWGNSRGWADALVRGVSRGPGRATLLSPPRGGRRWFVQGVVDVCAGIGVEGQNARAWCPGVGVVRWAGCSSHWHVGRFGLTPSNRMSAASVYAPCAALSLAAVGHAGGCAPHPTCVSAPWACR